MIDSEHRGSSSTRDFLSLVTDAGPTLLSVAATRDNKSEIVKYFDNICNAHHASTVIPISGYRNCWARLQTLETYQITRWQYMVASRCRRKDILCVNHITYMSVRLYLPRRWSSYEGIVRLISNISCTYWHIQAEVQERSSGYHEREYSNDLLDHRHSLSHSVIACKMTLWGLYENLTSLRWTHLSHKTVTPTLRVRMVWYLSRLSHCEMIQL